MEIAYQVDIENDIEDSNISDDDKIIEYFERSEGARTSELEVFNPIPLNGNQSVAKNILVPPPDIIYPV